MNEIEQRERLRANDVKLAAKELNRAIEAAVRDRLNVDVTMEDLQIVGIGTVVHINARIAKPL